MNRADIFKIFDVELNITIFLGALVATFIYFITSNDLLIFNKYAGKANVKHNVINSFTLFM